MATALRLSGRMSSRHRPRGIFHHLESLHSSELLRAGDCFFNLCREDEKDQGGKVGITAASTTRGQAWTNQQSLALEPRHHFSVQQKRTYHATSPQPLVLYGTIIILTAAGYVVYRKSQGKPIAPDALIDAKKEFQETGGQYSRAAFERRQAEKLRKQKQDKQLSNANSKDESEEKK